jgi:hypothetical protein
VLPFDSSTSTDYFVLLFSREEQMERRNIREAIAEAETAPLSFEPKTRAQYVRDMVKTVEDAIAEGKTKPEIKEQVPDFARDYTNLFDMLTEPNYNKQMLKTMLALLDQMGTGNLTQHQASVIVGQRVADAYIKK